MKKYISHIEIYTVAVDEVDFCERLKPSAVMQYFQDLATVHAEELGIGFKEMLSRNLIWVLTRMSVKYYRYPRLGEKISVITFPRKPHIADAVRDYYILAENGEIIISGSSKWIVIDVNSHVIRRCATLFDFPDEKYMPNAPFDNANITLTDSDGKYLDIMSDRVHVSELDRNGHMNNARYGDIVLNSFEPDWLKSHKIEQFEINFLNEMKYGDNYRVYCSENNCVSHIRTERDGVVVFRAEVTWSENV